MKRRNKDCLDEDSKYYFTKSKTGEKYGYVLEWVKDEPNPYTVTEKGIVARDIDPAVQKMSVRDKTQADIAELESEISSLENIRKGKISPKAEQDLFLAGEMRLSRQAGAEVRKLNDRISNLEKQLQQANELLKQSVADAELAGEIHVARQAAEEMGKKDNLLQQRKERINRLQEELDSVRKKK